MSAPPRYRFTTRADGDFAVDGGPGLAERRAAVAGIPWTWLRQVHGARAVVAAVPGHHAGDEADAAVTVVPGAALSVQSADCVPVVLLAHGPRSRGVGAVHAGWRGLVDGVVEASVDALLGLGPTEVRAVVGPHIGPECYAFGPDDLDTVAARFGDRVRARQPGGAPTLDLLAAATAALTAAGVGDIEVEGGCTACDADRYFSHRARQERERLAAVVWLPS